jgi:hypothetical protein
MNRIRTLSKIKIKDKEETIPQMKEKAAKATLLK